MLTLLLTLRLKLNGEDRSMKAYKNFELEVLELEEDIVRTSVEGDTPLEDPISQYDDVISDF